MAEEMKMDSKLLCNEELEQVSGGSSSGGSVQQRIVSEISQSIREGAEQMAVINLKTNYASLTDHNKKLLAGEFFEKFSHSFTESKFYNLF